MIYIAHRGNIKGRNPDQENSPTYIENALNHNFHCEIDIWYDKGALWSGHDEPQYRITYEFLERSTIWCHAKNIQALEKLLNRDKINCFYGTQGYTLTSHKNIWIFNSKPFKNSVLYTTERQISVAVLRAGSLQGICSDYIEEIKQYSAEVTMP